MTRRFLFTAAGLLVVGCQAFEPIPAEDARIQALSSEDGQSRVDAAGQLVAAGAPAVSALVTLLDRDRDPSAKMAYETLYRIAGEAANTGGQREVATALAGELKADHSAATRNHLCRFISYVAGDESVAALDQALDDPEVREMARWALARIPTDKANRALAHRLKTADPDFKVALINALGEQGNPRAVPVLRDQAGSGVAAVRLAALDALACIPHQGSCQTIIAAFEADPTGAAEPLLTLAETLADAGGGQATSAEEAFATAARSPSLTVAQRCRVLQGLARVGGRKHTPFILAALGDQDPHVRSAAVQACALKATDPETVRLLVARMASANNSLKIALLEAFGGSGAPAALPVLQAGAADRDCAVRVAAFKAMGRLNVEAAFDTLLAALLGEPGPDRDAAEAALSRLRGQAVTARLLAACKQAVEAHEPRLLRVLSWRQDPEVRLLLLAKAKAKNTNVRIAAVEGLGRQGDPSVAPALLATAKRGPAKVSQAAVHSYLGLLWRIESEDRAQAGRMYNRGLELATNEEHQRIALNGISRTVDPKDPRLLPIIKPLMAEGGARREAANAAAVFAMHLPESRREEAIEILTAAVKLNTPNMQQAVEHLRGLGVDIDPAREAGFITCWWLTGPFPQNKKSVPWSEAYFPQDAVDLKAGQNVGGKVYAWKPYRTPGIQGIVDLQAVATKNDVGAHAYAEVTVDQGRDVLLKMGSDDAIVVWVNGKKVHANNASRGVRPDQDEAKAHLEAGVNNVLVKVINKGGPWGFCLRLNTTDGNPVGFEQRMK